MQVGNEVTILALVDIGRCGKPPVPLVTRPVSYAMRRDPPPFGPVAPLVTSRFLAVRRLVATAACYS